MSGLSSKRPINGSVFHGTCSQKRLMSIQELSLWIPCSRICVQITSVCLLLLHIDPGHQGAPTSDRPYFVATNGDQQRRNLLSLMRPHHRRITGRFCSPWNRSNNYILNARMTSNVHLHQTAFFKSPGNSPQPVWWLVGYASLEIPDHRAQSKLTGFRYTYTYEL